MVVGPKSQCMGRLAKIGFPLASCISHQLPACDSMPVALAFYVAPCKSFRSQNGHRQIDCSTPFTHQNTLNELAMCTSSTCAFDLCRQGRLARSLTGFKNRSLSRSHPQDI